MVTSNNPLEIKNLSLLINDRKILDNISFSVAKGEFLAVIGPNGAGKSSMLKCLGNLYKHFDGEVELEGKSIKLMREFNIAKKIAWVHQTGSDLLPFTVREFCMMSRYPWETSHKANIELSEKFMSSAHVLDLADRRLDTLSGGERQRALLAAALTQTADILFLDEPTSFLDYRHQVEMLELIKYINKELGITVLMVTHDVNLALCGAGRIAALKNGRLVWSGSSTDLLEENTLSHIFDTPFEIYRNDAGKIPHVAPKGFI